jgi:glucose-1-phosphatase
MIKLFVFDLGNVILPFDHRQIATKLLARSGKKDRVTAETIFSYLFDLEEGSVNGFEEGLETSLEFFNDVRDCFDLDMEFDEFGEIWNSIFRGDPEVDAIIRFLKGRGFPLYLLSNTNELHFAHIIERYPIVHLMDEWILSFEVGAKKPKARIYESIFELADAAPHEVFYVDDVEGYIAQARSMGIRGTVFKEAQGLWKALEAEGIGR